MDHLIARIDTELRWHDAVLDQAGKLTSGSAADAGSRPVSRASGSGQ
jgi:hypothetical protein